VNRIFGTGIQLSTDDLSVVGNPDQDDPPIGVGERDNRLLKLIPAHSGLELDVLVLFAEDLLELVKPKRQRKIRSTDVERRIWRICFRGLHGKTSMP
jgi:hypothetical protein